MKIIILLIIGLLITFSVIKLISFATNLYPVVYCTKFCNACNQNVLCSKIPCNHVLHIVLMLVTCGFWLPVWIVCGLLSIFKPYKCPYCAGDVGY